MNVFVFCKLSLIFGGSAGIYVFLTQKNDFIKKCESTLDSFQTLQVYCIRFLHYSVFSFLALYPFTVIINLWTDLIVAGFIILIYLHWQILGGCILIILEKRILIPENVECPTQLPFLELLSCPKNITNLPEEFIVIPLIVLLMRLLYSLFTI
jgi:hypothetical protein